MARVYIDFESFNENVIEMSAVLIFDQKMIDVFHNIIQQTVSNRADYILQAKHSHCMDCEVLEFFGTPEDKVKEQFIQWLKQFNFEVITIAGHGLDTTRLSLEKWIPELTTLSNLKFEQVILPPWIERQYGKYHIDTFKMKELCQTLPCGKLQHGLAPKLLAKNRYNHSHVARYIYGFHCSLFDCFELAFFENTLPSYCCDFHFQYLKCTDLSPYILK